MYPSTLAKHMEQALRSKARGQPLELRKMKWKRIHSEAEEERWEKELFQGLIDEARERMTLDREVQQQRSNKRRAAWTDARAHTRAHTRTCTRMCVHAHTYTHARTLGLTL